MKNDSKKREQIIEDDGNIIVSASAGAGKTTIIINKIIHDITGINDHKTFAALTFTTKATKEIQTRLSKKKFHKNIVVMTNDAFVDAEIIRPFIKDAMGQEYPNDFIIKYNEKIKTFDEGMQLLKDRQILAVYKDDKLNFKFELALRILEKSIVANQYLVAKYKKIFLDEYQDTDIDMHKLFMYINKMGINLFIVGDKKQAIYLWRGAMPDIFNSLEFSTFNKYELSNNFRSDIEIVNYANFLHDDTNFENSELTEVTKVIHAVTHNSLEQIPYVINKLFNDEVLKVEKEITIIANKNKEAEQIADALNEKGYNFVYIPKSPIDDIISDYSYFMKIVAKFFINPAYTKFSLLEDLHFENHKEFNKVINEYDNKIKNRSLMEANRKADMIILLTEFSDIFGIKLNNHEINALYETIINKRNHKEFLDIDSKWNVMTVFSSKGLEFDQVITFDKYYSMDDEKKRNNHYVAVTRAKDKFVMIEEDNVDGKWSEDGKWSDKYVYEKLSRFNIEKSFLYKEYII